LPWSGVGSRRALGAARTRVSTALTRALSRARLCVQVVRLGDGVRQTGGTVVATAAGEVCYAKPGACGQSACACPYPGSRDVPSPRAQPSCSAFG